MATLSHNTSLLILFLCFKDKKRCKPLSSSHNDEIKQLFQDLDRFNCFWGAMSQGYCCFRSLLCLSHYLVPLHQMFDLWSYEEDTCIKPTISSAGSTNHKIFRWHFCSHGIKNWKSWPKFFNFQSMSILVIILSQQVTGNSLNASIKYCCTFQKHANSEV